MFDRHFHLHSKHRPRARHLRYMRMVSGMLGIAGIGFAAYAIGFVVFFKSAPVSIARGGSITVTLRQDDATRAVAPLRGYSLADFAFTVSGQPVQLASVSFTLDGLYALDDIAAMRIMVDGAQAGNPVQPDAFGVVRFDFETMNLDKGEHTVAIALDSNSSAAIFQTDLAAKTPFAFTDSFGNAIPHTFLASARERTLTTAPHGELGAFIKEGGALGVPTAPRVGVYAEGESIVIDSLRFQASVDLTGERFDIFIDDVFITAAVFDGREAQVEMASDAMKIAERRTTDLVLVPTPGLADAAATAEVVLEEASVTGDHSRASWQTKLSLPIL